MATKETTAKREEIKLKRNKAVMPDWLYLGLCFLMPAVLMGFIWGDMGISYGGRVTPLIYDMKEQFVALFASLRYVVSGENSLFYTWGEALGGNNLGMIAYYVASPLSWITVFFALEDLPDAIYLLTLIKIGLCGVSFGSYIRYGLLKKKCGIVNVLFACCYALMSYNIVYSSMLMWIDGVIMLPLILLGIEKLVEGRRGGIYLASLATLFVSNYYISYMVGLFAAVYVVCRAFGAMSTAEAKEKVQVMARFVITTVLAVGLAAPVLLTAAKSLSNGKALMESAENDVRLITAYGFNIVELLQKFMPSKYDGLDNSAAPSVYCGILALALAVAYFFQKQHSRKEKIGWFLILLIPFSGFVVPAIDYIWHAFQYPNSFPYRYAFLVPAIVLVLATYAWEEVPKEKDMMKILPALVIIYTFAELYFNGFVIVSSMHREYQYPIREDYAIFLEQHDSLVQRVKADQGAYRTEFVNDYLVDNSAYFFGVNGSSSFVSTFNGKVNSFLCDMGSEEYSIFTTAKELTPLGDSLLGIKYRITEEEQLPGYKCIASDSDASGNLNMYLHENENPLSLGYLVENNEALLNHAMSENPYENQNQLLQLFGVENYEVFRKINYTVTDDGVNWHLEFDAPSDNDLYLYINGKKNWVQENPETGGLIVLNRKISVGCMEGDSVVAQYALPELTSQCIGTFEPGEKIVISISGEALEINDVYLYEMDTECYKAAVVELQSGQLEVESILGGTVKGNLNVLGDNGLLFTSIPADGGHVVKIDGQETESTTVFGTFLAIPVEKGTHEITISYRSPGFDIGILMSGLAIVLTFLYFLPKKNNFLQGNGCKKC